jgi:hypothetical protein
VRLVERAVPKEFVRDAKPPHRTSARRGRELPADLVILGIGRCPS